MSDPIGGALDIFHQLIASNATRLQPYGEWLVLGFGVIKVSWTLIKTQLQESDVRALLAELIQIGIVLSMIVWVINDIVIVSKQFFDGFDMLAAAMAGTQDVKTILEQTIAAQLSLGQTLFDRMDTGSVGILDIMRMTVQALVALVVKLVVFLSALASVVITVVLFFFTQVAVAIAIFLMPICLPFLMAPWDNLQQVANGWMKYAVTTGFIKLVSVAILIFSRELATSLDQQLVGTPQENPMVVNLVYAGMVCGLAVSQIFVTLQIPSIAAAIAGGVGSGMSNLNPKTMTGLRGRGSTDGTSAALQQGLKSIADALKKRYASSTTFGIRRAPTEARWQLLDNFSTTLGRLWDMYPDGLETGVEHFAANVRHPRCGASPVWHAKPGRGLTEVDPFDPAAAAVAVAEIHRSTCECFSL